MNYSGKRIPEQPAQCRQWHLPGLGAKITQRSLPTVEGHNWGQRLGCIFRRRAAPPNIGRRRAGGLPTTTPLLLMCLLALLLSGCLATRVVTTPSESSTYASPESALQAISTLPPGTALSATARIRITYQERPVSLRAALMIRKPASLRLESIPLMGSPDFFLSISNDEMRVFLPLENGGRFYIGRATPENLSRFFPLPLPPAMVVSLLLGEADQGLPDPTVELQGEQENQLYRIDQYHQGLRFRSLWIDPVHHVLVRIRWFDDRGEGSSKVEFRNHLPSEAAALPQEISISHHDLPEMVIRYDDVKEVSGETVDFTLPLPDKMVPLRLD